jgi:hypothetical protein
MYETRNYEGRLSETKNKFVTFEIPTSLFLRSQLFWNTKLFSWMSGVLGFEDTLYLHLPGLRPLSRISRSSCPLNT